MVNKVTPSLISFIEISGAITASFSIRPVMYIPSVESFLRNLYLAGRFLKRFLTSIVVPEHEGHSETSFNEPSSYTTMVPFFSSLRPVVSVTSEQAAMEARASPLKPIVERE